MKEAYEANFCPITCAILRHSVIICRNVGWRQRLEAIAQRLLRMRMNLDDQTVRPGRHRRPGHRRHEAGLAGAVARIDHDGQMRVFVQIRHRCQRQREARVILEGADAALAEHHFRVAGLEDVLRGQQEFVHRRRRAALQQHRQARFADRFQQRIVLHVAGADLQHVGVGGHQFDVLLRHHLRDDRQPRCVPRLGQQL